jgi:hypothetical protein
MGIWILLSLVSGFALFLAVSINRPLLMAATAIAMGLSILMVILRIILMGRMKKAIRRP